MGWKAFVANVVGSLAWPGVFVILLFILRKKIVSLATELQEISLPGGAKATFRKDLETARTIEVGNTAISVGEPMPDRLVPETEERRFLRLAATAPEAAVLEAYKNIEEIVSDHVAPLLGVRAENPAVIVAELVKRGYTTHTTLDLFNTLRQARNNAAHVTPGRITSAEALDYGEHAKRIVRNLSYAIGRLEAEAEHTKKK